MFMIFYDISRTPFKRKEPMISKLLNTQCSEGKVIAKCNTTSVSMYIMDKADNLHLIWRLYGSINYRALVISADDLLLYQTFVLVYKLSA